MLIDLLETAYPWIKALHVIAVISWMAGLFYLPRLFVYHAERAAVGSELDQTFQVMEEKLLRIIMRPAMIVTWVAGLALVAVPGVVDWGAGWAWVKAAAVIAMTGVHHWLGARAREFAVGTNRRAGRAYRIANEVPTVLLFLIVVAVIVRPF
jgi:protoporphyrinogen IX oxidase